MPTVEFHALNISAKPHPPGIYRQLFERFANKRAKYYGEKIAAFSKPSDTKDGVFWGYIFCWTYIDKRQPIIDTILLQKPDQEKLSQLNIPDGLGFNWQSFYYVFRERDHTLVFESRNMQGHTLAPNNAEKIFRGIFDEKGLVSIEFTGERPEIIEVDLFVESSAIKEIFSIGHLREVKISISTPNADVDNADADAIIERLRKLKARKLEITYKSESAKVGIVADEQMRSQAEAALPHGYVKGEGYEGNKPVSLSSKSYARSEKAYVNAEESGIDTAVQMAKRYFFRSPKPETN